MTDGLVLPPGAGRRIESAGMTLKVGTKETGRWSVFEADVPPGFDVGAHVHAEAEELFYILEGELDLLAFEPQTRTSGDWQAWRSSTGATVRYTPSTTVQVRRSPGGRTTSMQATSIIPSRRRTPTDNKEPTMTEGHTRRSLKT